MQTGHEAAKLSPQWSSCWLAHFGAFDFSAIATATGRHVLLQRHGAALRQQLGADVPEEAITGCIDELCGHIVTAARQVVAVEQVLRAH